MSEIRTYPDRFGACERSYRHISNVLALAKRLTDISRGFWRLRTELPTYLGRFGAYGTRYRHISDVLALTERLTDISQTFWRLRKEIPTKEPVIVRYGHQDCRILEKLHLLARQCSFSATYCIFLRDNAVSNPRIQSPSSPRSTSRLDPSKIQRSNSTAQRMLTSTIPK